MSNTITIIQKNKHENKNLYKISFDESKIKNNYNFVSSFTASNICSIKENLKYNLEQYRNKKYYNCSKSTIENNIVELYRKNRNKF